MRTLDNPPNTPLPTIPGVSVIVPTYRGGEQLDTALKSLAGQRIDPALVEVIVVENGPKSTAHNIVERLQTDEPEGTITWKVIRVGESGAGRARNVGLAAASREYITFLDDDDWLEPEYLTRLLDIAAPNTVAVTDIVNLNAGAPEPSNSLSDRIRALPKSGVNLGSVPWVLGFVACKLVHRDLIADAGFPEHLRSGEDVAFFAHLLRSESVLVRRIDDFKQARYCRSVDGGSVSRRQDSFDFLVSERLDVIERLNAIGVPLSHEAAKRELVRAQSRFIARYYEQNRNSERAGEVLDSIAASGIADFPWDMFREDRTDTLVFSYCFPPDADTSSNVMAKRIMNADKIVDVISNDMHTVRDQDERFYSITQRWLRKHTVLTTPTSFANWGAISEWAEAAVESANQSKQSYTTVYSRALWIASHVAGFLYKKEHPEIRWIAEFSDPLAKGADGQLRFGPLGEDSIAQALREAGHISGDSSKSLFEVVEKATLAVADEVVFTNPSQQQVILEAYDSEFAKTVSVKARVEAQPHPKPFLYGAEQSDYQLDPRFVNVAYFGAFYPNRGISNVVSALETLSPEDRGRLHLHVFTNSPVELTVQADSVTVNGYRSYLEFLNLARRMDVLLVTDTTTGGTYSVNPFLPSKYADYAGSGTPIWGIIEDGSPLSNCDLAYVSRNDQAEAISETLKEILRDFEDQQEIVGLHRG